MIKYLTVKDHTLLKDVADLHRRQIPTGFLSSLGDSFLFRLYQGLSNAPGTLVAVHLDEKSGGETTRVNGFLAGSLQTKDAYRHVLGKQWYRLLPAIAPALLRPFMVQKLFETVQYGISARKSSENPTGPREAEAELLAIAVHPDARRRGVGGELIGAFEEYLREQTTGADERDGRTDYKVVTWAENATANAFYSRSGFELVRSFRHHKNEMNEYVKRVS